MIRVLSLLLVSLAFGAFSTGRGEVQPKRILVDDFEQYDVGSVPFNWKILSGRGVVPITAAHMAENEWFSVFNENGNNALRVYTHGEVATMFMPTDEGSPFEWNFSESPSLSWDWRALRLPEGGREDEDRLNDSGIALYVIFSIRGLLIRRPTSIKYTYSSTLPVGTIVSYGRLKVVVVSSALDGINSWQHVERNVAEDYRTLFGHEPPPIPLGIRLWSDTDNMDGYAEAEFDNIVLK